MEKRLEKVPGSNLWTNIRKIKEGFDECTKYFFVKDGQKFIIKIFPKKGLEKKEREFCILQRIQDIDFNKPKPITMGKIDEDNYYYILTWVEGKTLTEFAAGKNEEQLYEIGKKVGEIMHKIHEEKFDNKDLRNKIDKIRNKITLFRKLNVDYAKTVINFLENNIEKLEQQPKSIVHGDLNQDNIIIDEKGNVGIIDFGNSDIDYSYQDTHQIQMYNRFLSKGLSTGVIDGYIQGKDNQTFWESYKIYSAYYCLSKIIWAYKFKDAALIKDMLRRAKQTVEDFDYFRSDKPIWYEEYKRKNLRKGEHEER